MYRKARTLWFAVCISLLVGATARTASVRKPARVFRSPRDAPTTGCYIIVLKDTTTLEVFEQILFDVKEVSIDKKVYAAVKNVQKAFTVKLSAKALKEVSHSPRGKKWRKVADSYSFRLL